MSAAYYRSAGVIVWLAIVLLVLFVGCTATTIYKMRVPKDMGKRERVYDNLKVKEDGYDVTFEIKE